MTVCTRCPVLAKAEKGKAMTFESLVSQAPQGGRPSAAAAPIDSSEAAKFLLAYTVYFLLSGLINMVQGISICAVHPFYGHLPM